jgi:phosphomannomutase
MGKKLSSQSFIEHLGEENYKYLVNFVLKYLSEMDIPIKRCVVDFDGGKKMYLIWCL